MKKYTIVTDSARCSGCLRCRLACSFIQTGSFQPSAAMIRIVMRGLEVDIEFDRGCTDCGRCADECCYGALEKKKTGDVA